MNLCGGGIGDLGFGCEERPFPIHQLFNPESLIGGQGLVPVPGLAVNQRQAGGCGILRSQSKLPAFAKIVPAHLPGTQHEISVILRIVAGNFAVFVFLRGHCQLGGSFKPPLDFLFIRRIPTD